MNKRGISTVVATVLIVLITVAAVTILWAAIAPLIDQNLSSGTACLQIQNSLTIDQSPTYTYLDRYGTCGSTPNTLQSTCAVGTTFTADAGTSARALVKVRVERAANTPNLKEIKIILDHNGATVYSTPIVVADMPTEGGTKVITINLIDDATTAGISEGLTTGKLTARASSSILVDGEVKECASIETPVEIKQKQA